MDAETRGAFAEMSATLAEIDSGVRGTRGELVQARREVHSVSLKVGELHARTGVLEAHVFGSKPPPKAPSVPLVTRTTGAEHDVDALQGRLLAVEAELVRTKEEASGARAEAQAAKKSSEETRAINEKQSAVMGIPSEPEPTTMQTIVAFVKSREGRKLLLALATFAFAAFGARAAANTEARVEHAPVVVVQDGGTP